MNKKLSKLFKIMFLSPLVGLGGIPGEAGSTEGTEGTEGQEGTGTESQEGTEGQEGQEGTEGTNTNKTFTQADIDNILARRLKQQEKKIKDKFELEQKKSQMSDIEKANLERDEANKKIQLLEKQQNENNIKFEIMNECSKMGNVIDPEAVYSLIDKSNFELENGKVQGIKEALSLFFKDKPYLLKTITTQIGDQQNSNKHSKNSTFNDAIRKALGR